MKEDDFKKIIENSEVKTKDDFTDRLMAEIESNTSQPEKVKFWSLLQIAAGFIAVTVVSGVLVYHISSVFSIRSSLAIPLLWSLLLLFGLNHLLSLQGYRSYFNG